VLLVEIVGTLVGTTPPTSERLDLNGTVDLFPPVLMFASVDDGTGTIQCTLWHNKARKWEKSGCPVNYQLGDLVCIQGKLTETREGRKVVVYQMRKPSLSPSNGR